jgi:hypothetical protein
MPSLSGRLLWTVKRGSAEWFMGGRIGQENVGVKRNRGFSPKIFFS